jgi:hypothetical protein
LLSLLFTTKLLLLFGVEVFIFVSQVLSALVIELDLASSHFFSQLPVAITELLDDNQLLQS